MQSSKSEKSERPSMWPTEDADPREVAQRRVTVGGSLDESSPLLAPEAAKQKKRHNCVIALVVCLSAFAIALAVLLGVTMSNKKQAENELEELKAEYGGNAMDLAFGNDDTPDGEKQVVALRRQAARGSDPSLLCSDFAPQRCPTRTHAHISLVTDAALVEVSEEASEEEKVDACCTRVKHCADFFADFGAQACPAATSRPLQAGNEESREKFSETFVGYEAYNHAIPNSAAQAAPVWVQLLLRKKADRAPQEKGLLKAREDSQVADQNSAASTFYRERGEAVCCAPKVFCDSFSCPADSISRFATSEEAGTVERSVASKEEEQRDTCCRPKVYCDDYTCPADKPRTVESAGRVEGDSIDICCRPATNVGDNATINLLESKIEHLEAALVTEKSRIVELEAALAGAGAAGGAGEEAPAQLPAPAGPPSKGKGNGKGPGKGSPPPPPPGKGKGKNPPPPPGKGQGKGPPPPPGKAKPKAKAKALLKSFTKKQADTKLKLDQVKSDQVVIFDRTVLPEAETPTSIWSIIDNSHENENSLYNTIYALADPVKRLLEEAFPAKESGKIVSKKVDQGFKPLQQNAILPWGIVLRMGHLEPDSIQEQLLSFKLDATILERLEKAASNLGEDYQTIKAAAAEKGFSLDPVDRTAPAMRKEEELIVKLWQTPHVATVLKASRFLHEYSQNVNTMQSRLSGVEAVFDFLKLTGDAGKDVNPEMKNFFGHALQVVNFTRGDEPVDGITLKLMEELKRKKAKETLADYDSAGYKGTGRVQNMLDSVLISMGRDRVEDFLKEMGAQKNDPLGFTSLAEKVGKVEFGSLEDLIKDFSEGIAHLDKLVEKFNLSPGGPCPDSSCPVVKLAKEVLLEERTNVEEFKRQTDVLRDRLEKAQDYLFPKPDTREQVVEGVSRQVVEGLGDFVKQWKDLLTAVEERHSHLSTAKRRRAPLAQPKTKKAASQPARPAGAAPAPSGNLPNVIRRVFS